MPGQDVLPWCSRCPRRASPIAFSGWQNGLCRAEARELLMLASTPAQAARLTRSQLRSVLQGAGRSRGIEAEANRLGDVFGGDYLRQPQLIEDARCKKALALLRQLGACAHADGRLDLDLQSK
ncbi:hypothetical protein [Streptomyces sp. NPDC055400]